MPILIFLINAFLATALTGQALPPALGTDIAVNPDFLPAFTPRPGTSSTLATAAGPLRVSGNVLLDMGSGETYSPSSFQLTTENKFVYNLDKAFGIRTVSYPDGNTLTFSSAGISHSAGKSIAFTRDAAGRITAITDPEGRRIAYGYTPAGDLVWTGSRENWTCLPTFAGFRRKSTQTFCFVSRNA